MSKKLYLLLIVLIPFSLLAQSPLLNDTAYQRITKEDCDGKIFYRVEQIPVLKVSKEAYEDSLKLYLKSKNALSENYKIKYRFLVTSRSQILEINKELGDVPNENILREALVNFASLWLPARQNSYVVCAHVRLELVFRNDKLKVTISQ